MHIPQKDRDYDADARDLAQRYDASVDRELGSRRIRHFSMDAWNPDNWPQMADWLHERFIDFRRIIEEEASAGEAAPEQ